MDRKEPQVEVTWVPATPIKPVPLKPMPIYTPGEMNQMGYHASGAVACVEFSIGQEKLCRSDDGSYFASEGGKTCEHAASDAASSFSKLGFCEHLFAVEAESRNYSVIVGNNDGLNNPFFPSFILDNVQDPQEPYIACCSNRTQDAPFTLDNANKEENKQIASMQLNMEEKDPGGEERNSPASMLDSNVLPNSKELCDPVIEFAAISSPLKENNNQDKGSNLDTDHNKTPQPKQRRRKHRPKVIKEGKPKRTRKPVTPKPDQSKENPTVKRKYVRKNALTKMATPTEVIGELTKEMPESAKMSCRRSLNFDIGARYESSAGKKNTTDLNTSIMQPSNSYMSLAEDTQAPNTSSGRKSSVTEPEENSAVKKNMRRKVNSSSPTEVTGDMTRENVPQSAQMSYTGPVKFYVRARDQSHAIQENPIIIPGDEIGVVMHDINVGFAYDLNTAMKHASNSYMSLPEETQAANTSSRKKRSGTKPAENPTAKRKYVRKKGVKTYAPPMEVPGEFTKEEMSASAQTSCTGSINFDERPREKSYTIEENLSGQPGSEIGAVMQEMNVRTAYELNTSINQKINEDMTLPKDAQALSPSSKINLRGTKAKENLTGKRKNVRKKGLNLSPIPSTEMTGLTEAVILESNNMSWRRSLNSDMGTRDGRSVGRENLDLHIGNKNMVLEETKVCLAYSKDTWMPLPEGTQYPSTSISKYTPLGAKLDANSVENKNKEGQATTQDGNISTNQSSAIRSHMVGSKRKYTASFNHADDSNMNLIGSHYNGLSSYQASFCLQFPNIQKKRRTEKGKTSDTYITSVTATKEVQQTYPQEDALGHRHASSSSSWIYGTGYNTTGVPVTSGLTENFIDGTQTFNEFVSSLKRLAERSQTSTCGAGSPTKIRSCDTEPSYTTKHVRISGRETFEDAKGQQTCIGALIAQTPTSLTKKKRSRKKSALSSSAHSRTNGMLQHRNFTVGNYPMPVGKSSDVASKVLWKNMNYIDSLALQFWHLNINTEARDLALHEQNALVLYKQQNQKQNSLVRRDGAIIPFQIKKQHLRPKVDLDEETDRVWKLLLLDINSHGIDGTDEDKTKWWEEERNVFRGRADSFIARMHLVQGIIFDIIHL
ncbi:unnamed protein product [Sphenostylis stenocarpa]|uniref:Uncharacterized protein n=1 Tax=Sphenostylis stenocarpa TaxID=92480 RepID=A0AA86SWC1_9FABA|nr:unnamed protein product [Sphenostylis stenocarpa]